MNIILQCCMTYVYQSRYARQFYCEMPHLSRYRRQILNTPTVNGACFDISKDTSYQMFRQIALYLIFAFSAIQLKEHLCQYQYSCETSDPQFKLSRTANSSQINDSTNEAIATKGRLCWYQVEVIATKCYDGHYELVTKCPYIISHQINSLFT